MNTKRILITGGRAPVALYLARLFKEAGHIIYIADSLKKHLSKKSNVIEKNYLVQKPNVNYEEYISNLIEIIKENNIDILIPTSEEVFHISKGKDRLSQYCTIFTESIDKMNFLHNKWLFIQKFKEYNFNVPKTWVFNSKIELQDFIYNLDVNFKFVLKPVYSRFASNVMILKGKADLPSIDISKKREWVLQEFIEGEQICTYSIVHNGKITAYSSYPTIFTAGLGANIHFKHINNDKIYNIVNSFVKNINYTGQISFDFIVNNDGEVYPLECNPRATSGVHLFTVDSNLDKSFLNPNRDTIFPSLKYQTMLSSAMFLYGITSGYIFKSFRLWFNSIIHSKDVIFSFKDPLPYFYQFVVLLDLFYKSILGKKSLLEITTEDIEWGG